MIIKWIRKQPTILVVFFLTLFMSTLFLFVCLMGLGWDIEQDPKTWEDFKRDDISLLIKDGN